MFKISSILGVMCVLFFGGFSPTSTQSQTTDCQFVVSPTLEYAPVYSAPLSDGSQLITYASVGFSYPVLMQNGIHYQIQIDGQTAWVDRRSGVVNRECTDISMDTTPLSDFETVCMMTTTREVYTFTDQTRQTQMDLLPANTSLPITQFGVASFYVLLDSARGGWLSDDAGVITGDCERVPQAGASNLVITNAETNVWSQPDVTIGDIVQTLDANTQLMLVSPPVRGAIRVDTDDVGEWYFVALNNQSSPIGWVWIGRLEFVDLDDLPTGDMTATALNNARLWSLPDVRSGVVIAPITYGTQLTVIGDSVQGAIRYDTDDLGEWYQVRVGALIGWIWAGRLQFD